MMPKQRLDDLTDLRPKSRKRRRLFKSIMAHGADWVDTTEDPILQFRQPEEFIVSGRIHKRLVAAGFAPPSLDEDRFINRFEAWFMEQDNARLLPLRLGRQSPTHVHVIGGARSLFFDFRGADLLAEDLQACGLDLATPGLAGMDFGSSTGRTVRTFGAAFADLELTGVDPVASSIRYASSRFPQHSWLVNAQRPPMAVDSDSFDFAYAKSVWTHFSAQAGIEWMSEIARVLKPGGLAAITVHGWHDLARRVIFDHPSPPYDRLSARQGWEAVDFLKDIVKSMAADGYWFRPFRSVVGQSDLGRQEGVDTTDWGLTFFTHEWAQANLERSGMELVRHAVARNGHRHDILVFRKSA